MPSNDEDESLVQAADGHDDEPPYRASFLPPPTTMEEIRNEPISTHIIKNLADDFKELEVPPPDERIRTYLRIRPKPNQVQPTATSKVEVAAPKSKTQAPQFNVEDNVLRVILNGPQPLSYRSYEPIQNEQKFKFTQIFQEDCSQSTVFDETTGPLVNSFFDGDKCLVFSYGATNSGKTFTMQGYGTNFGIVPRTLDNIFNRLEERIYTVGDLKPTHVDGDMGSVKKLTRADLENIAATKLKILSTLITKKKEKFNGTAERHDSVVSLRDIRSNSYASIADADIQNINSVPIPEPPEYTSWPKNTRLFSVWISFVEIYNEKVYDLFCIKDVDKKTGSSKPKEVKVVSDGKGGFYMRDYTELSVCSAEEAYQLFQAGKNNLKFASTKANQNSSRSHSFFNIRIVKVVTTGGSPVFVEPHNLKMSFCDLAGVERIAHTGNEGVRLNESNKINNSLLQLLHCIRELRQSQKDKKKKQLHFRDSKLTQLFSDYLTEHTRIAMIVNVNPDISQVETSLTIMHNSAIASDIVSFRNTCIEPPQNDSNFFRKFRESIGIFHGEELPKGHQDSDEDSGDEEGAEGAGDTVKRAPIVKNQVEVSKESKDNLILRLELENAQLKRELDEIEQATKENIIKQYDEVLAQVHRDYEKNAAYERKQIKIINERRLSLSLKIMDLQYQDELEEKMGKSAKAGGSKAGAPPPGTPGSGYGRSKSMEEEEEDDDDDWEDDWEDADDKSKINGSIVKRKSGRQSWALQNGAIIEVTPPPRSIVSEDVFKTPTSQVSRRITDYFGQNQELARENGDLKDAIQGLQRSLDEHRKRVHDLTEEGKENTRLYAENLKNLEEMLENKNREMERYREEHPEMLEKELNNEIARLGDSIQEKNDQIVGLQRDVEDGRLTCVEYHRKLEQANSNIKELTNRLNTMHRDLEKIKLEKNLLEVKNAEIIKENRSLKCKIGLKLTEMELSSDEDNENVAPRRSSRASWAVGKKSNSRTSSRSKKWSTASKRSGTKRGKGEFDISVLDEDEDEEMLGNEAGSKERSHSPAKKFKGKEVGQASVDPEQSTSNSSKNSSKKDGPPKKPQKNPSYSSSDSEDDIFFKKKPIKTPANRTTSAPLPPATPSSELRRSGRLRSVTNPHKK